MLANFLNKSKPINFIGLLFFFVICFLITVFNEGFELGKLLKNSILLLLFFGVFFFFNFIINKNKLTSDNSIAYFVFTLLIVCILPELLTYKSLIIAIIYLLFLRKIYSLRTPRKIIQKLFDSSFWMGVLFIIEPLSILFLALILIGVYLHQKITIHTLITPVVGFATPVFIYFTYFFWFDKTVEFKEQLSFNIDFKFYEDQNFIWLVTLVFIVTIISIVFKSIQVIPVSNTFRRNWGLLVVHFLVATILILMLPEKNNGEFVFILFPVSVIITNGIQLIKKKLIKNLIFHAFLVGCIFFRFFL